VTAARQLRENVSRKKAMQNGNASATVIRNCYKNYPICCRHK